MWADVLLSMVFGILAVLVLALLEFVTLLLYFRLRQKYPQRKFLNEVIVMAGTILVSFIARFIVAVLYKYQETGSIDVVWDGMSSGLFALFALIGGLTFEGTYAPDEMVSILQVGEQILYYGAVAYAGVSTLLILSTSISYEFYSFVKVVGFLRKYDTVYIFTDVTEEGLLMAEDIVNRHNAIKNSQELTKAKKAKKIGSYAIMFMGNELEAFDGKNDLHREIMDRDYIYWSYGKVGDKEKELSLLKKLNYTKKGCKRRDKEFNHNKMLHIFTLRCDSNLYAAENQNSSFVFDDVECLLKDYCKCLITQNDCQIPTVVNYYLLTHGDINYEFYNNRCNQLIDEFFAKHKIEDDKVVCDDGSVVSKKQLVQRCIQLHILSEAKLTADDLVSRWQKAYSSVDSYENYLRFRQSTMPNQNNIYRTAIFGFGKTGQYAMKGIYTATSNVTRLDDGFVSSQFIADVYDSAADKRSGEFAYAHPLFLCKTDVDDHTPLLSEQLIAWGKKASNDALDYLYDRAFASGQKLTREQVWKDMGLPIIDYHRVSCLRQDFMNKIDGSLGIFDKKQVHYNSFVVSMGNDEDDIIMANILIDDFKHEILLKGKTQGSQEKEVITIFVHIRDEKNTHRLNWTKLDEQKFADYLQVVTFGCRESIWCYDNIIDDENASMYNYMYSIKSRAMEIEKTGSGELSPSEKIIMQSLVNGDGNWIAIANADVKRKDMWLDVNAFTRESNRSAFSFAYNYRFVDDVTQAEYCQRVEHLRWNRFHIANGWVYAEYGKEEKSFRRHNKQHTCLCPYDMLDKWTQAYDLVNVQVGKMLDL